MLEPKFIQGLFKTELKNRFLCMVEVNGEDTLCYIPSSCRLSNFVDLKGKIVLLTPVASPKSRTRYSVYALLMGKQYILLNMSQANRTIENSIHNRRFSFLGKRVHVRKEFKIDDYKSDLFIEDSRTIIEIKSILAFDKHACFPTVFSQRAIDQLEKINRLLDCGYKACYIFTSLNPKVKQLSISSEIHEYYELFRLCIDKGMMLKGYTLYIKDGEPTIHSYLNITV